jgi:hypothetical protein
VVPGNVIREIEAGRCIDRRLQLADVGQAGQKAKDYVFSAAR